MISLLNAVVVPPLIALIVSGSLVALLMRGRAASLALDLPNQRSLHSTPTPRLGGVGIVAGIAAAWVYANPPFEPLLLAALALLIGVSLLDDLKDVGVTWRLMIHVASAVLAAFAVLRGADWWVLTIAALAIAWMINLYNFMDGADGLAGGMGTIGFGAYGAAALAGGDFLFAAVNLSIAAAALGFLLFNFPPARVFMGDVGAIPLGCLAAVLDLLGWQRGAWPWWFGIVIFSPFIVDASLTLAKRSMRGAKVWQAHREHYYQRLIQSGWSHRKAACAQYALTLGCAAIAFAGMRQNAHVQAVVLGIVAVLYAALALVLEKYIARHAHA
ncbi:MAG TPA: glycosyltransferase family 4 protein [Burkholderiales bacterium]|nr:glycosyltransferase family 4 protein [Burkholderiales bacterium]